jgi:hypothetical protein
MAKYAFSNGNAGTQQSLSTSYKTQLDITAATGATTLRRAWIYDLMFGADGTPADNVIVWKADRQTSTGTRTSVTPPPLDAADAAALITCGANTTVEGIVTAATQLIEIAVNQRASYRWVAAPGGELVVPAVNVTGIGIRAKSPAYTGTVTATVHFIE